MYKIYTCVILLWITCMFFSCKQEVNKTRTYKVDFEKAKPYDFKSEIDSVHLIILETSKDHEIGRISKILFSNDKVIVSDVMTHSIYVFNRDGILVTKISYIGNGPGEYVRIDDVLIDSFANQIIILDGLQKKMVTYSMSGEYIKEFVFQSEQAPMHFAQINDELYALDYQRHSRGLSWKYNLIVSSLVPGCNMQKYLPYEEPLGISFSPRTTLFKLEDTLVYVPQYSPIVYNVFADRLDVRYSFDFGNNWINEDFERIKWSNAIDFMNALENSNFVYYFNLLESKTHIYVEFNYKDKLYHAIVDKLTGVSKLYRNEEEFNCSFPTTPLAVNGSEFIIPIEAYQVRSLIEEDVFKNKLKKENLNDLIRITEDSNPILMFITFK